MGALGLFDFAVGWEELLDSAGRQAQAHLGDLFRSLAWWKLTPDISRSKEYSARRESGLRPLISAGVGELRGLDFASAARSEDGRLMLAYLPTWREITVDLTKRPARWSR